MTDKMDFGQALSSVKAGKRVAREGWNGKGMWLFYVSHESYGVDCAVLGLDPETTDAGPVMRPWIGIKNVDDQFMPWAPSQSDMLAEDWIVV